MSRVRRAPREIITHGEDGLVVRDRRPVENDAERGRTAALGPKSGRASSKAAAGLRRLTGLSGLGVARRSRPVTVDCRVVPGGSLAFEVSAGQSVPRNWQLVLHPRSENIAATAGIQFEQPDMGGDRSVRAVLDKRHWDLAEGDWDVLLRRSGGSRSHPVRAGLVETARLLDPAALGPADEAGRTWIPYATDGGGLAVRTWRRPAQLTSSVRKSVTRA
ncbi:hypothetical protein ACWDBD_30820 [Streptomyces sp. NPDC001118]